MSKKKVLLRGMFINRDTNGEGVLKVGTTLIRVSTVMGILYYKLHHEDFCKRTVCEISKISNIVSSVGNEWVYNIVLGKGELIEF